MKRLYEEFINEILFLNKNKVSIVVGNNSWVIELVETLENFYKYYNVNLIRKYEGIKELVPIAGIKKSV